MIYKNLLDKLDDPKIFLNAAIDLEPQLLIEAVIEAGDQTQRDALANAYKTGWLTIGPGEKYPSVRKPILDDVANKDTHQWFTYEIWEKVVLTQILVPSWSKYYYPNGFTDEKSYVRWYRSFKRWVEKGRPKTTQIARKAIKVEVKTMHKKQESELKTLWKIYRDLCRERRESDASYKERCKKLYAEYIEKKKLLNISFDQE